MQMKLLKDIEMLIFHFLKDLTNNCKASLWSCRVNDILDLTLHHFKMLSNIVFSRVALRKGQMRELFVDSQLHNCTFVFVKGTLCIVHCILYIVYCVYVCECYVRRNGQLKAFMNISRVEGRRRRLTQVNRHHRHYNTFHHNDWCQIILLNQIADTSDIADISWIAVLFCKPWQLFIVWSSVSSPENSFAPNKANVHIVQILAIECYYRRVVIVQWPLKRYSIVQAEKWTIALWSSCSVALTSSVAVLVALWSSCSVAV